MKKILECKISRIRIVHFSVIVGVSPVSTRVRGMLLVNIREAVRNRFRIENMLHFELFIW